LKRHDISKIPDELSEFEKDLEFFLEIAEGMINVCEMKRPRNIWTQ